MMNGDQEIECQISDAALDELAGTRGTASMARQAQFVALRDAVEQIASDIYDSGPMVKGATIRIFTKHIPKEQRASDRIPPCARLATTSRACADARPASAGTGRCRLSSPGSARA
ncbi:hypothetical protein ABIF03_001052 [Bradyrhizobium elkanii]